ncbi:Small glutamine-rich tetratricopeptide repeat-containing protein beta (Beta-SGT) (Small glutamine-rich protein with tetratricopeptide repeats 2) [Durusdinium trenchii]|uniref:Small glutamine-rich tetratricopeptide repeat-containing protein beta (Beta-SGT) (Small glutamine-rich protein with tetratricopeptide repeats 2) n=1 Tax=Durusdinium trenchii TaxID=1381693 RepID=A0ABP0SG43_9DINO
MTTAEEFKEKGNEHFKRQEFALAVDAYNRAIELNPEECAFWLNRSNAYRQQGRWDLAEADAQQALTLSPGNAKALYGSAMCLKKLDRLPDALLRCQDGMNLHPENKAFRQLHREVLAALVRTQARDPPTAASSRSSSVDSEASEGSPKKPVRALLEEELPSQELCQLAMTGEAEKMVALLQSGAEVNWKRPKDGNTALHLAAEMGHLEAVQLLLECRCGFLCALGGRICCSPLNWALGSLHLSRADPEIHNHFALSPFALAQHDSAVEKLLAQVTRPLGERRYAMQL